MKTRIAAVLFPLLVSPSSAQTDDTSVLNANEVPQSVAAQVECGGPDGGMTRRAFAGGFVFAARCPGNNANYIQALIYADDEKGANARLLMFPGPGKTGGSDPADSLSNVRWYPKQREVTELFVDPESEICRTEGRWRLDAGAQPRLVYWRQTRDCEGRKGWQVLVDKRRK